MSWADWSDAVEIEPSIYASDFSRLGAQLEALHGRGRERSSTSTSGTGTSSPRSRSGPIVLASISPLVHGRGGQSRLPSDGHRAGAAVRGRSRERAGTASRSTSRSATTRHERSPRRGRSGSASASRSTPRPRCATPSRQPTAWISSSACRSIPGYSGQAFMPDALGVSTELRAVAAGGRAGSGRRRDQPRDGPGGP